MNKKKKFSNTRYGPIVKSLMGIVGEPETYSDDYKKDLSDVLIKKYIKSTKF